MTEELKIDLKDIKQMLYKTQKISYADVKYALIKAKDAEITMYNI